MTENRKCITFASHACTGTATQVVGAYPCCDAGAVAEREERARDKARLERYMQKHADEIAAEMAWEQALERRFC